MEETVIVARAEPDEAPFRDFVFISYAREDRDRLGPLLLEPLRYAGVPVWFDEHLEFDSSWWQTVRDRLAAAHAVVVVMSESAHSSQWVPREVTLAVASGKPLYPVLIGQRPLPELAERQMLTVGEGEAVTPEWLAEVRHRVQRGKLRRRLGILGKRFPIWLGVVAALVTFWQLLAPMVASDPLPDFDAFYNLGVAEFVNPGDEGLREDLATAVDGFEAGLIGGVTNALELDRAESGESLRVLTIQAEVIPRTVDGTDAAERQAAARKLVGDTGVHVLVYGRIVNDGALLTLQPELYVSPAALPRAEELAGRLELAPITEDISDPGAALSLRTEVAELGRQLAGLLLLVGHYDRGRWQEALDVVSDLRAGPFRAPGLLAVLEGNLLGKLGRREDARLAYESARGTPYAARASLGLAQVAYTEALDGDPQCGAGTDARAMEEVRDTYAALQDAPDDDGANLAVKAVFGEARARACLAVMAGEPDPRATEQLGEVVRAFEATSPPDGDLRELAAEAEALLGSLAGRQATTSEEAEEAAAHLDRAYELTKVSERRTAFLAEKLELYTRVGEAERACAVLDDLEPLLGIPATDGLRQDRGCAAR